MIPGLRTESDQRAAIVREARSWLGTPWHHAARIKGAGVDCGQFLIAVYAAVGIMQEFEVPDYPPDWHLHRSEERYLGIVAQYARPVPGPPRPGDIALFRWGRCLAHGAIVTAWPEIIHAYRGAGVILDNVHENGLLAEREAGFWSVFEEEHPVVDADGIRWDR